MHLFCTDAAALNNFWFAMCPCKLFFLKELAFRQDGSPNTAQGMFAHGMNGNQYRIREARPPPIKQEDPQKIPLDPSILFKINSIKQEPVSSCV